MKKSVFTFFTFIGVIFQSPVFAQTTTPYLYHSNTNNWSNNGISADEYRGSLGVKSHRFTFSAGSSIGNFYKIYNQSNNSDGNFNSPDGSKVWSGNLTLGSLGTAFAYGDGNGSAGSFSITNGKYYTYNWEDVNTSTNARAIAMETDAAPVPISSITRDPLSPTSSQAVTVTVNLSATPSSQERVYVRYSTDGFSTYGSLLSAATGSGTATQTFTIPAQTASTAIVYYAFTSTLSNASLVGAAAITDIATIYFNNNGGSNYSYTVLPIELTSFEAEKADNGILLRWETASERNNERFDIQRSPNGAAWSLLSSLPSQSSDSNRPLQYNFLDKNPLAGTNYYRLQQVDWDGKTALSKVVKIEADSKAQVSVYPNPVASDALWIDFQALRAEALVQLFDAQGRLLRTWSFDPAQQRVVALDLLGIAPGMLFLKVNEQESIKILR
jgi:hypothetical protein